MSVKHLSAILLIAGLLLVVPACSDDPPATTELCIEFTATSAAASGSVTSRLGDDSECSAATVELIATDIDDIFAFESHITYEPDVVSFAGYSTVGSILESDGADVAVVVQEGPELGELTIGATRVSDVSVPAIGDQLVMKLFFIQWSQAVISGALTVDEPCLLGNGEPPVPKNGVACSGGTLSVR
jgi:hypothetical protein